MNIVPINNLNNYAVQVATTGQLVKFTKGQKGLLNTLKLCVESKKTLSWDIIVNCYYENVRKTFDDYEYVGQFNDRHRQSYTYDVLDSYKKQDFHWTYQVRGRVKQWLLSTIGILVLKNQLLILPIINIEE
jgi:hypothetical protein